HLGPTAELENIAHMIQIRIIRRQGERAPQMNIVQLHFMARPRRGDATALDALAFEHGTARMRADELHRALVSQASNRLRVGMVLMVVRAEKKVDIQFLRRDQNGNLPPEIHLRLQIPATVGEIKIHSGERPTGTLENIAALSKPPERDG